MKIWIVNQYAVPASEPGGTRHYSLGRELVRNGHDVCILASDFRHGSRSRRQTEGHDGDCASDDGVRFVWLRTPAYAANGLMRLWSMLAFSFEVCRQGIRGQLGAPDVVMGSSPHPFAAVAARCLARHFGVPFVLEVRDLWPDSVVQVAGASQRHPLVMALRWLERSLYQSADAIVTLMPYATEHIISRGGAREKITWVPNGVDFRLATTIAEAKRRDPQQFFTVLYAGSHGQANALDSLLEAARILASASQADIQFRFIGDGTERDRLRDAAARAGLRHVHFEPAVPKHRIYDVLREADVLVASARNLDLYQNGISFNKLFDYLAVGRPIVFAANIPGNPVEEAGAGYVVPPEDAAAIADAILRIAHMSPTERAEMGHRGRLFAKRYYDNSVLASRLEAVFKTAVANRALA